MNQVSDVQEIGIFSDQSPRSKIEEGKLREEAEKINHYVSRLEEELVGMEKDRSRMLRLTAIGQAGNFHPTRLQDCVREIRNTRDNLEALEKECAKIEQEIAVFHPTAVQSQARSDLQSQFTEFAKKRFAKTKQVEALLQQFRQALKERSELAGKMREIAEALDCEINGDVLDEERFSNCLSALPDNLLTESQRWQSALGLA